MSDCILCSMQMQSLRCCSCHSYFHSALLSAFGCKCVCTPVCAPLRVQLDACGGELRALAFWWANLAHLRGLLLSGAPALSELLIPQVGVGGEWLKVKG